MRIAILTSRKAFPLIKDILETNVRTKKTISLLTLPITVIGYINVKTIVSLLERNTKLLYELKKHDIILVPGNVKGNTQEIEKIIGKPVYKASREPDNLPDVIELLKKNKKLSHIYPADELLKTSKRKKLIESLKKAYEKYDVAFNIGKIKLPVKGPPIILASETTTSIPPNKLPEQVIHYEESGADIVIAGIPLEEEETKSIERIKIIRKTLNKAELAVDSSRPKILKKAIEIGAELVFSLHKGNMDKLLDYKDKAFVIIPGDPFQGITPVTNIEATRMLEENIKRAKQKGFKKIIADPILSPPGNNLDWSIYRYKEFKQRHPETPLMMGLANVIELIDADSPGMNMLLSQIAAEMGISLLLVSEESWKAKNSTLETRIATLMSTISTKGKKPPINIGVDLLFIKEKKPKKTPFSTLETTDNLVEVPDDYQISPKLDNWGYVTINIDHESNLIHVCLHKYGETKPKTCYYGRKAQLIYKTIMRDCEEFSIEHAAYLGYELAKAEIALITGKKYIQDEPFITSIKEKYGWLLKEYNKVKKW